MDPTSSPVTELVALQQLRQVSEELATAKAKLAEERRRNEQNLDNRLTGLDDGQKEIIRKIDDFPNRYIKQEDFDKLEGEVKTQGRIVYVGLGIALVVQLIVTVAKWHS